MSSPMWLRRYSHAKPLFLYKLMFSQWQFRIARVVSCGSINLKTLCETTVFRSISGYYIVVRNIQSFPGQSWLRVFFWKWFTWQNFDIFTLGVILQSTRTIGRRSPCSPIVDLVSKRKVTQVLAKTMGMSRMLSLETTRDLLSLEIRLITNDRYLQLFSSTKLNYW